jgi:hypothetical protein
MPSSKHSSQINPRTTHYEFLGPPGTFALIFLVPVIVYALYFGCSEATGGCPPHALTLLDDISRAVQSPAWWKSLWDTEATLMYCAWYTFCVITWFILPGDWVEGVNLRTGGKKKYKINGELSRIWSQPSSHSSSQPFPHFCLLSAGHSATSTVMAPSPSPSFTTNGWAS